MLPCRSTAACTCDALLQAGGAGAAVREGGPPGGPAPLHPIAHPARRPPTCAAACSAATCIQRLRCAVIALTLNSIRRTQTSHLSAPCHDFAAVRDSCAWACACAGGGYDSPRRGHHRVSYIEPGLGGVRRGEGLAPSPPQGGCHLAPLVCTAFTKHAVFIANADVGISWLHQATHELCLQSCLQRLRLLSCTPSCDAMCSGGAARQAQGAGAPQHCVGRAAGHGHSTGPDVRRLYSPQGGVAGCTGVLLLLACNMTCVLSLTCCV